MRNRGIFACDFLSVVRVNPSLRQSHLVDFVIQRFSRDNVSVLVAVRVLHVADTFFVVDVRCASVPVCLRLSDINVKMFVMFIKFIRVVCMYRDRSYRRGVKLLLVDLNSSSCI